MSYIDYVAREVNFKIVYYGPGLSGKTTNLQFLHDKVPSQSRHEMISLKTEAERTVFFDYLPMDFGTIGRFRIRLHLYSVPGQVSYDASRRLVLKGVDGIVFVADSQIARLEANVESLDNLKASLSEEGTGLDQVPYVIQYNKRDFKEVATIEELRGQLNPEGAKDFEAVAPDGRGVHDALRALVHQLLKLYSPSRSLDDAMSFADLSPRKQGEVLNERLGTKFRVLSDTGSIAVLLARMTDDFPLNLEHCLLLFSSRGVSESELMGRLSLAQATGPRVAVVISTRAARQDRLFRLASNDPSLMLVVPDGTELTRLLLGPAPIETFAHILASQIKVSRVSPYVANGGVQRDVDFYGRTQMLADIVNRDPANYLVVGGRQLGKTSLLRAIERRCNERKIPCSYIQLTGDDLNERLAKKLDCPASSSFEELARHLSEGGKRFLLIDECDGFIRAEARRGYSTLRHLRSLSGEGKCYFVLAGFWDLYRATYLDYQSPVMNFGEGLRVEALEPAAARALITRPMRTLNVRYESSGSEDRILDATAAHANLISIVCNELLKTVGVDKRVLTRDDVERATTSQAVRSAMESWKALSGAEEDLFADEDLPRAEQLERARAKRANRVDRVIVYGTVMHEQFTIPEIARSLASRGFRTDGTEINRSVARLELAFVVGRQRDHFYYRVPLFKDMLRAEQPEEYLEMELEAERQDPTWHLTRLGSAR